MTEEQQILASSFYTLINSLVVPTDDWEYGAASSMRVAIVSSDLAFQYGEDGENVPNAVPGNNACNDDPMGDDGKFQMTMPAGGISVDSNVIKCDEDAAQCPDQDWTCENGKCVAPDGAANAMVACPSLSSTEGWTEITSDSPNPNIATQVSCMAQLGNGGCGIEQQLSASIRALSKSDQHSFIRDNHMLAVLVISDEEDCSVENKDLFTTDEWTNEINTACNIPDANGKLLFIPSYFHDKLVALKDGNKSSVLFAAIVGVPPGDDSPCQGTGDNIDACLEHDKMQYEKAQIDNIWQLSPACERYVGETLVTRAGPGRRYVQVAQEFGCASYVYSICNDDWSAAMKEIARLIAACVVV
jgi:hypothetical protein